MLRKLAFEQYSSVIRLMQRIACYNLTPQCDLSITTLTGIFLLALIIAVLSISCRRVLLEESNYVSDQSYSKKFVQNVSELCDDVTVVTAFFNIGSFGKSINSSLRRPKRYRHWMSVFARLNGPVVAYFDTDEFFREFTRRRKHLPANLTIVKKFHRKQV